MRDSVETKTSSFEGEKTLQFTKPDVESQTTDSYKKALATTPYTNPIQNFN